MHKQLVLNVWPFYQGAGSITWANHDTDGGTCCMAPQPRGIYLERNKIKLRY